MLETLKVRVFDSTNWDLTLPTLSFHNSTYTRPLSRTHLTPDVESTYIKWVVTTVETLRNRTRAPVPTSLTKNENPTCFDPLCVRPLGHCESVRITVSLHPPRAPQTLTTVLSTTVDSTQTSPLPLKGTPLPGSTPGRNVHPIS